jgi:hypothetical protein
MRYVLDKTIIETAYIYVLAAITIHVMLVDENNCLHRYKP